MFRAACTEEVTLITWSGRDSWASRGVGKPPGGELMGQQGSGQASWGRKGCRCAPVAAGGLGKLEAPSLERGISCAWFGGGRMCLAFSAWY